MPYPYSWTLFALAAGALGLTACGETGTSASGYETDTSPATSASASSNGTGGGNTSGTSGLTGPSDTDSVSGGGTTGGDETGGLENTCEDDSACGDGQVCFQGECFTCTGTAVLYGGGPFCCEDGTSTFEVDTKTTELTFEVTVDGQAPPKSSYDFGHILLRYGDDDDLVYVGRTNADAPLKARVLALDHGYQVLYEAGFTGATMPINGRSVVTTAYVSDPDVAVSIPTAQLEGALTIDGDPAPASKYDSGALYLHDPDTGARTLLEHTYHSDPGFRARVIAGRSYQLRYGVDAPGNKLPRNGDAIVDNIYVDAPVEGTGPMTHDVAITTTMVGGAIRLDGATPPPSEYENGALFLRDSQTGDIIKIGETRNGSFDAFPVFAGTSYDLFYSRIQTSGMVPANEWAFLGAASVGADHDLESQTIEATIALDGQDPVATPGNQGRLLLRGNGDTALLGALDQGLATGRVLAEQAYDLYYGHEATDGGLPANTRAFLNASSEPIDGGLSFKADAKTALISGAITINGEPAPQSAYDNGRVYLRAPSGDQVLLGQTRAQSYQRRVLTGTYDLCYGAESVGPTVPRNGEICFQSVTIDADVDLPIDIPSVHVTLQNTKSLGSVPLDRGRLYLRNAATGDEIFAGTTDLGTITVPVVPGPYWLVYQLDVAGPDAPRNQHAHLACQTIAK